MEEKPKEKIIENFCENVKDMIDLLKQHSDYSEQKGLLFKLDKDLNFLQKEINKVNKDLQEH